MKNYLLAIVICFAVAHVSAQPTFQKLIGGPLGDYAFSIQQTSDGGFIIAGGTSLNDSSQHIYLVKTDANLDTVWTKTFGGNTGTSGGVSVKQTADGGFIVTGTTDSHGVGMLDVFLVRTDASGNLSWSRTYGDGNDDYGKGVEQTTDGGFIVGGYSKAFGSINNFDAMLIRTDPAGDTIWTRKFGDSAGPEYGNGVQQADDGGFVLAGATTSFANDLYLVKTDPNGDTLWTKMYGGASADQADVIRKTNDGGFILVGNTNSFATGLNTEVYAVRIDANGDTLWTRTYGSAAGYEFGNSVWQTSDNGFIIGGYTSGFGAGSVDVYLVKIDGNGAEQWSKAYGGVGPDYSYSVIPASDGGYIAVGYTENFGATLADGYIVKTDAAGNSGCQEADAATVTTMTSTTFVPTPTFISSGTIVTNPATTSGSNGGGVTLLCTNGVESIKQQNDFKISPNPSSGDCTITLNRSMQNGLVEVYNTLGEKVQDVTLRNQLQLEIQFNLAPGLYFVKLSDNGIQHRVQKLVVQ